MGWKRVEKFCSRDPQKERFLMQVPRAHPFPPLPVVLRWSAHPQAFDMWKLITAKGELERGRMMKSLHQKRQGQGHLDRK